MQNKKSTNLDEVLGNFSVFGRYHLQLMLLIVLAYACNSIHTQNYVFAAEETGYRCRDEGYGNDTCSTTKQCSEWLYDNPRSFVAEFQIACQEWKRTLVGTVHSLGYMVGLLIVGPLSDRLGRKNVIVLTGISGGLIGLAKSVSPSYWLYIALEFLESVIGDICSPAYVLNIETVSADKRVLCYGLCCIGYTLGSTILPLIAWLVPYWRNYLIVIYSPALLFIFYYYILDESPRWLLAQGKKDQAIGIIEKAADKNKMKVDQEMLDTLYCEEDKGVHFLTLLKITFSSRTLLKRCVICIIWWMTSTFVNYGMMINSVSLQGNQYINFGLVAIVSLPGNFIMIYLLTNFKRRNTLIVVFITGALLCVTHPCLPCDLPWLSLAFYMAGKLMGSFYFFITYMYTSELFPTYTRNSMHALCSSIGRIGSIIAPQTPLLMGYWTGLPSLVFGCVALIAGMVTFLVPDISNNSLPDTVKQAEALGTKTATVEGTRNKSVTLKIPHLQNKLEIASATGQPRK